MRAAEAAVDDAVLQASMADFVEARRHPLYAPFFAQLDAASADAAVSAQQVEQIRQGGCSLH